MPKSRWLYLPPSPSWQDFWTGEKLKGDQSIEAQAPIERIPLYIRAGAILPMGPEVEYANEKPDTPIELRIYRGADGSFNLYKDRGNTYAYEKGAHATIPIQWHDANHTLTFGRRQGQYLPPRARGGKPRRRRADLANCEQSDPLHR